MQLSVKSFVRGIRCDLTGKELFDSFSYYSLTGQPFHVDQGNQIINPGPEGTLDIDMSEEAFNHLWGRVRDNIGNAKAGAVKCDLSPRFLQGRFTYWKINIVKVDVDIKEVDGNEKLQASVVSGDEWDLNASDEEVQKLLILQKKHCTEPFDEGSAPRVETKREVIRIPAPKSIDPDRYKDFDQMEGADEIHTDMYSDESSVSKPKEHTWQHAETGRVCLTDKDLGPGWIQIPDESVPVKKSSTWKEDLEVLASAEKQEIDPGIRNRLEVINREPTVPKAVENDPAFYQKRVEDIITKGKQRKIPPASPVTPEPEIEFEPEITKKVQLPDTGTRTNFTKRKKK